MSPASPPPEPHTPRRAIAVFDPAGAEAALAAGADAIVFEAPVPPRFAADLRARRPALTLYAALDGLDDASLDGFMELRPDGVLLRAARCGRDAAALGARLAVCEARIGLPDGATAILAVIGDPLGVIEARSFAGASPRLAGLGVDGAALAAGLGEAGALAQARSLIRLAAAAAGVAVFDMLTADEDHSPERLVAARRNGFDWIVVRAPARLARRPCGGAG